jgi:hypothetical protein
MHTPNHLLSPEMAIIGGVVAATLIGVAISKVRREPLREKLPLAGTLGAFVFAVQMLNIAIGNVARYMRAKSYEYNQEHPNNELIIKDIKRLSKNDIEIDEVAINSLKSD